MALKKLTPSNRQIVETQCSNWLKWQTLLSKEKTYSDNWFNYQRERNACWETIIRLTGLNKSQSYNLIYKKTSLATYWLPDGEIRKDYPHE